MKMPEPLNLEVPKCANCTYWRKAVGTVEGDKINEYGYCRFFESIGSIPFWYSSPKEGPPSQITDPYDGCDCKAYQPKLY